MLYDKITLLAMLGFVVFYILVFLPVLPIFCLCEPELRWLCVAYLIWIFKFDNKTCETGGRANRPLRHWKIWKYVADYYPVKLLKVDGCELDPGKNYLFCDFPHSVAPLSFEFAFGTEHLGVSKLFPHHTIHTVITKFLLCLPFERELMLSAGAIAPSTESLNYVLDCSKSGNVAVMFVGGAHEALMGKPGCYRVILKNRKGFVRIALQNGSPLVPVITFGDDSLELVHFQEGSLLSKVQIWMKNVFGMGLMVAKGRGVSIFKYFLFPRRTPITIVVGRPIDVERVQEPTQEQVDNLHQIFVEKLKELFDEQKKNYVDNSDNVQLEIL